MRGLALGLTALVLLSLAAQSGMAVGPPGWTLVAPPAQIAFGQPIDFSILGPPGQQVTVAVNAQPYNLSVPIFTNSYTMPETLVNGTASTLNLSIPSTLFDLGRYQLTVQAATGLVLGQPVIELVSPLNFSALPGELATIWATLNATLAEYANTNAALAATQTDYFVSVAANFAFGFIIIVFLTFTRTRAADTRWGDRLRRFGQRLGWGDSGVRFGYDTESPRDVPPVNPAATFVGKMYPSCPRCTVFQTEAQIIQHYRAPITPDPKTTGHNVPVPIRGIHYTVSNSMRRIVTRARSDADPEPGKLRLILTDPSRPLRVDMEN